MFDKEKNRGFTLIIAIVAMSLLLIIGYMVVNITSKQFSLTLSERESQKAFFAANSGIECALYWDNNHPSLPTAFATSSENTIICNGQSFDVGDVGYDNPMEFQINLDAECVLVSVTKTDTGGSPAIIQTNIEARGYNVGSGNASCQSGSKRVERAIQVDYTI